MLGFPFMEVRRRILPVWVFIWLGHSGSLMFCLGPTWTPNNLLVLSKFRVPDYGFFLYVLKTLKPKA